MEIITEQVCPKCGHQSPRIGKSKSDGSEHIVCFECGYTKVAARNRNDFGEPIDGYTITEIVDTYGAYKIEFTQAIVHPEATIDTEDMYELIKENISQAIKKEGVKRVTMWKYVDGQKIVDELWENQE